MATNAFLPFAHTSTSNCVDDATYSASLTSSGAYPGGFETGLAKSSFVNKALRQSSVMASVLGQIIADDGNDAYDSDTVTNLEDNLLTALFDSVVSKLPKSLGVTGYQTFPGGLIRQWGTYDSGSGGLVSVGFPITFPTAAVSAFVCENNAASTWISNYPVFHGTYGLSKNSMVVVTRGVDTANASGWGPQQSTGNYEVWGY